MSDKKEITRRDFVADAGKLALGAMVAAAAMREVNAPRGFPRLKGGVAPLPGAPRH